MVINDLMSWVQAVVGDSWRMVDGGFPEDSKLAKQRMCVIKGEGGPAPDVDDRRPRYRIILLGPQKERAQVAAVREACEAIMQAMVLGETTPCGVAGIRAMGEPIGPSYTAEDRAWMSLNLQLSY